MCCLKSKTRIKLNIFIEIWILSSIKMALNFQTIPNWSFTQNDQQAKKKLSELRIHSCGELPPEHLSRKILLLFKELREAKLYSVLKTLPKGVLHHLHFDCSEDEDFYAEHVIPDPIVYLSSKMNSFEIGTKEQAEKQGWVTMQKAREKFQTEKDFIKFVSNFTMLNKEQLSSFLSKSTAEAWDIFEKKISNFFIILGTLHLFKKYTVHILRKLIKNGYDRLEFRALLHGLKQYNEAGQVVKEYGSEKFMEAFDESFEIVKQQHPALSAGFIFFGLKFLKAEENVKILSEVLEKRWSKTIGIDFVQQEDPNGSQAPYDEVANTVLAKFPDLNVKKVYHSGETRDHLNRNVQISIKAGSARIGHGINVIRHPYLLQLCREKQVCFELCPVSNLVMNYISDPRGGPASLLMGLGIPVSLNSDDPGKFGLEDTTMDFMISFISSNWSLKHLKLLGIHSINHAICSEETRKQLVASFNTRWDQWIQDFIAQ